jgi:hypothetical protein
MSAYGPENLLGCAFSHGEVNRCQTKGIMQSDRRISLQLSFKDAQIRLLHTLVSIGLDVRLTHREFFRAALSSRGTVGVDRVRLSGGLPDHR